MRPWEVTTSPVNPEAATESLQQQPEWRTAICADLHLEPRASRQTVASYNRSEPESEALVQLKPWILGVKLHAIHMVVSKEA